MLFIDFVKNRAHLGRLFACLLMFGLLALPARSQSDETDKTGPSFKLRGFGTLGVARTSKENLEFVRDLSQPYGATDHWTAKIDSLVGLQANIGFTPQTEIVVQGISRYHSNGKFTPELNWGFLRHDLSDDLTMRVGRLGTEFYMLADSRLVGYSNLMIRPQGDFYGSLIFSHMDGADATYTLPVGEGALRAKFSLGRSPEQVPVVNDIRWNMEGTRIVGGYLDYQTGPWQMRASRIGMRFKHEMPFDDILAKVSNVVLPAPYTALVPEMTTVNKWAWYDSLGLVYNDGPLLLQFMVQRIDHQSAAYEDSRAGQMLVAYTHGTVTPYVGLSRVMSRADRVAPSRIPVLGGFLDAITTGNQAQTHNDHTTLNLGARWDFRKDMALKAQWDRLSGNPESIFLFRGKAPKQWDGRMNVFSLALDFVF